MRARQRYERVQALKAEGKNVTTVMRELRLAPGTARRYYRAASVDEVAGTLTGWPSKLDDHKPFLHQRWNSGCTNIGQLHREITERGYRGSYGTVYAYLRPFKALPCAPPAVPAPPKVRHITSWILRDPATLDESEQASLDGVRARCLHLDALASHVTEFAKILTGRRGEQLDAWIAKASAGDQPDLRSFIRAQTRLPGRAQRTDSALQLWQGRRQRQPDQDAQTANVRRRRIRPAPQASPAGITRAETITKCGPEP